MTTNKEYLKAYYQAHKEDYKRRNKEWVAKNKERNKELQRNHYYRNQEELAASSKERRKKLRAADKEKVNADWKVWRLANHDKVLSTQRLCKYGLDSEAVDLMISMQDGCCAICKKPPSGKRSHSKLHVDHDHESGRVRAFLCGRCNSMLGLAADLSYRLRQGADYLEKYGK